MKIDFLKDGKRYFFEFGWYLFEDYRSNIPEADEIIEGLYKKMAVRAVDKDGFVTGKIVEGYDIDDVIDELLKLGYEEI